MDPPTIIRDGAFQPASAAAQYNLAEIWPFPINGGESGSGLDFRRVQLGHGLAEFTEASVYRQISDNDPMVVDHRAAQRGSSRKRRDVAQEDASARAVSTSNCNGMTDRGGKRIKTRETTDGNLDSKAEVETNSSKPVVHKPKVLEPPKQDYIHVRARRGQATDSHSLAERVIYSIPFDSYWNNFQSIRH
ncbi:hypothetical protein U1Q18_029225 [Sarracenia purpurea var. burkii]